MSCTDLSAAPSASPGADYRLRSYHPGDETAWLAIHRAADPYNRFLPETFDRQFGERRDELPRRQVYLLNPAGTPVGTATAWYGDPGPRTLTGRVHWVAIVPEEQGRGLAKPLLSAVCQRLLALGHRQAYLTTSIVRIPAINLYFAYGFLPDLDPAPARQAWAHLLSQALTAAPAPRPALLAWLQAHLPASACP